MKCLVLQFLASEMVESAMLRFLATTLIGLFAFCAGFTVYLKTPEFLGFLIDPFPMGVSAAIAVFAASIVAWIPFERISKSGRRVLLPIALIAALAISGVAGFYFGEAVMGI